jgi:hypothetical protein
MNDESERTWKEAVVAILRNYYGIRLQGLRETAETLSGKLMPQPRFEPDTFRRRVRSCTAITSVLGIKREYLLVTCPASCLHSIRLLHRPAVYSACFSFIAYFPYVEKIE